MPPKRGRGAKALPAASSRDSQAQAESAAEQTTTNDTQPAQEDVDMASPNTSPASAPTETPAPTPARATPVQRLESLTRSNSDRGRGRASASKFKPRAIRRGKEEREQAEKEELDRRTKAAGAVSRGRGDRGRGRGAPRGRGDAMGRGGLNREALLRASGPFGQAPQVHDKKPGLFAPGNGPRGNSVGITITKSSGVAISSSGIRIKQEPGVSHYTSSGQGGSSRSRGKANLVEDFDPIYPEEEDGGAAPRVDIEHINLLSDDEDEDDLVQYGRTKGKGRAVSSKGGMRPVRLAREEHKERVTIVNTEPAATPVVKKDEDVAQEVDGEGLFVDHDLEAEESRKTQVEYLRDGKIWPGAQTDGLLVKPDPEPLPDTMDVDDPDKDIKPRVKFTDSSGNASAVKTRHSKSRSGRNKKPVLQTEEDKEEYLRHLEDVQILAQELGGLQTALASESADGLGNDAELNGELKDKEGRLYLFQFPPILPPLRNPVKKEEDVDNDISMSGVEPVRIAGGEVDLTKGDAEGDVEVKIEPGQGPVFKVAEDLVTEAGFIGKLVVRESGKVELNWGGTSLALGRGAEFDFLSTTLILDGMDEAVPQGGSNNAEAGGRQLQGHGTGMGRVMGKFVATPDWSKLFER